MKLLRYGNPGAEKPGLLDAEGRIRDLSSVVADIAGDGLTRAGRARLAELDPAALPLVEGAPRLGPCVGGIGKICCIGLNFTDHAAEMDLPIPAHPVLFLKATSAISGPNDPVMMPRGSQTSDWEVELGVVIGDTCKYATPQTALDHVAGYCIVNDVTERTFQMELSGQWTKGKSPDTFAPIGPWLVTPEEVGDPHELDMYLDVNGTRMQTGNTRTMIFTIAEIVSHLSQLFTLHPGDVISTGTPPGVGVGRTPQVYLRTGDVMELGIDRLGMQRQVVGMDA